MKKYFLSLIILFTFIYNLYCEDNVVPLKTVFGGKGDDYGSYVHQTEDGGYIVTGDTNSFSADIVDIYLIKTDNNGNELWHKTYSEDKSFDSGIKVFETEDSGYLIAGLSVSDETGIQSINLIETDYRGNRINSYQYECAFGSYNIRITKDGTGSFIIMKNIITSSENPVMGLEKIDSTGRLLWETKLEPGNIASQINLTYDGGYIITGYSSSGNAFQAICLIKTDKFGKELWLKNYSVGNSDGGNFVLQAADRGYIVLGTTSSFGNPDSSLCLIKTDSSGNEEWIKTFGSKGIEFGLSVLQTDDGGYLAAGWTYSYGNGETADIYLVKTDKSGEELWHKIYGGFGNDCCFNIEQTGDSGYIITGYTESYGTGNSDVFLIKTDSQGNIEF